MKQFFIDSGLILGVVVSCLLFFFRRKNANNFFIALTILSVCLTLFINYLNATQRVFEYPSLLRTANIPGYLIFPFLYVFVRNAFYPGISWRRRDWLFLLPCLVYIVDLFPFFLKDPADKIAIMRETTNIPYTIFMIHEGWLLPIWFHAVFRYFYAVFMMVLVLRLILRNRILATHQVENFNRPLFYFILSLAVLHLPLVIPGALGALLRLHWYSLDFINLNLASVCIATSIYLLFSPNIIYGFELPKQSVNTYGIPDPVSENVEQLLTNNKRPTARQLANERMVTEIERIERHMSENKPFLKSQYTIHDLGIELDIPVYQLSPIINHFYKSNFNAWINKYRVLHFMDLCKKPLNRELTIDALAKDCGFSNRITLTTAFKKVNDTTPGLYFKQQREL